MTQFISAVFAVAFFVFWLISAIALFRLYRRVGLYATMGMMLKIVWVKRAIESEPDAECRKQLRRFLVGFCGCFACALPLELLDMWQAG